MTSTTDITKTLALDPTSVQEGFKTWSDFGERVSGITLDAATTSNRIAAKSALETFANLRDVAIVREEPAEYGRAFADFAQKQAELALRTAEALGGVMQTAQASTTELVSKAGTQATETAAANAESATKKAARTTKKAA